jgi:hypothetical protein
MQYCIGGKQKYAVLPTRDLRYARVMRHLSRASKLRLRFCLPAAALVLAGVACVHAAHPTAAPDPLQTDGDKYHVVLDNTFVRVLRYHDEPGAATRLHHHPCFVMYALGPFERELTFPDGKRRTRSFRAGEAVWMSAQSHTGHNIGSTPTEALIIELKAPCA